VASGLLSASIKGSCIFSKPIWWLPARCTYCRADPLQSCAGPECLCAVSQLLPNSRIASLLLSCEAAAHSSPYAVVKAKMWERKERFVASTR
jgi:hypothetical protein